MVLVVQTSYDRINNADGISPDHKNPKQNNPNENKDELFSDFLPCKYDLNYRAVTKDGSQTNVIWYFKIHSDKFPSIHEL